MSTRITPSSAVETAESKSSQLDQFVTRQVDRAAAHVRWIEIATHLAFVATLFLGALLTFCVVDAWIISFSSVFRLLILIGLVLGSLGYCLWRTLPLLLLKINPVYAAKIIEDAQPGLKNSLLNYLTLRNQRKSDQESKPVPRTVMQMLQNRAATDVSNTSVENTVDRSNLIRIGFVLIAIMLLAGVYKMVSPKDPFQSIARLAAPLSDISTPSRVRIHKVTPGDVEIFFGESVDITVEVKGHSASDQVTVIYSSVNQEIQNAILPLQPDSSGKSFSGTLTTAKGSIQQTLKYWVVAGDTQSNTYRVNVSPRPTLSVNLVELTPPKYTQLPARKLEQRVEIDGLEGTRVKVSAIANLPMERAWIELVNVNPDDPKDVQIVNEHSMTISDQQAVGEFVLRLRRKKVDNEMVSLPRYTHYRLQFASQDGKKTSNPAHYPISIQPDLAPEIDIIQPDETNSEVAENRVLPIAITAQDPDFKISSIELTLVHKGKEIVEEILPLGDQNRQGRVDATFEFLPSKYRLKPGSEVVLYATAADDRTSPLSELPDPNQTRSENYFIKILPPVPTAEDGKGEDGKGEDGKSDDNKGEDGKGEDSKGEDGKGEDSKGEDGKGEDSKGKDGKGKDSKGKDGKGEDGKGKDSKGEDGKGEDSKGKDSKGKDGKGKDGKGKDSKGDQNKGQGSKKSDADKNKMNSDNKGERKSDPSNSKKSDSDQQTSGGDNADKKGADRGDPSKSDKKQPEDNGGAGDQAKNDSKGKSGNENKRDQIGDDPNRSSKDEKSSAQNNESSSSSSEPQSDRDKPLDKDSHDGERFEKLDQLRKDAEKREREQKGDDQNPSNDTIKDDAADKNDTNKNDTNKNDTKKKDDSKGGNSSDSKNDRNKKSDPGKSGSKDLDKKGSDKAKQNKAKQNKAKQNKDRQNKDKQNKTDSKNPDTKNVDNKNVDNKNTDNKNTDNKNADGKKQDQKNQSGNKSDKTNSDQAKDSKKSNKGKGGDSQSEQNKKQSDSPSDQDGKNKSSKNKKGDPSKGSDKDGKDGKKNQSNKNSQSPDAKDKNDSNDSNQNPQGSEQNSDNPNLRNSQSRPGSGNRTAQKADDRKANPVQEDRLTEEQKANLDYTKEVTDLALEYLEDQKHDPDQELLKQMNWSKEELNEFLNRWNKMKQNSDTLPAAAKQEYTDKLRSLGLSDPRFRGFNDQVKPDQISGLNEDGAVSKAPPEYAKEYLEFQKLHNKVRRDSQRK